MQTTVLYMYPIFMVFLFSIIGTYSLPTDFDCILHVNPHLDHRGLAMIFNPTCTSSHTRKISLPLYYTGLSEKALVLREGRSPGAVYMGWIGPTMWW